ncbi:MAG: hypothetical protein U0414_28275 [Polyangiaceae bacterium]
MPDGPSVGAASVALDAATGGSAEAEADADAAPPDFFPLHASAQVASAPTHNHPHHRRRPPKPMSAPAAL